MDKYNQRFISTAGDEFTNCKDSITFNKSKYNSFVRHKRECYEQPNSSSNFRGHLACETIENDNVIVSIDSLYFPMLNDKIPQIDNINAIVTPKCIGGFQDYYTFGFSNLLLPSLIKDSLNFSISMPTGYCCFDFEYPIIARKIHFKNKVTETINTQNIIANRGALKATIHPNQKEYWIAITDHNIGKIYIHKLDSNGNFSSIISSVNIQLSNIDITFTTNTFFPYSLKFAPDGKTLGVLRHTNFTNLSSKRLQTHFEDIVFFNFNPQTGFLSPKSSITLSFDFENIYASLAKDFDFSPNSKSVFLGVNSHFMNQPYFKIYKEKIPDSDSSVIALSTTNFDLKTVTSSTDGYSHYFQTMPNGEILIYVTEIFGTRNRIVKYAIYSITNPNDSIEKLKISHVFRPSIITTTSDLFNYFPNLVNLGFSNYIKYHKTCQKEVIVFKIYNGYSSTTHWNFGDGTQDTSATNNISHTYQSSGIYKVVCRFSTPTGWDSAIENIDIKPLPALNIPNDTLLFSTDSILLVQQNNFGTTYLWSSGDTGQISTFKNPAKYVLTTTDSFCKATDSFMLHKVAFNAPNLEWCANTKTIFSLVTDADSVFNLTEKIKDSLHLLAQNSLPLRFFKKGLFIDSTLPTTIKPLPTFSLGADTMLCSNTNYAIGIGANTDSFLWNDNFNSKNRIPKQSGAYTATAFYNGCHFADTANIAVINCTPVYKIDCLDSIATFTFDPQVTQLNLNINGVFDTTAAQNFIALKFKEAGQQTLNWQLAKDSFSTLHQMEFNIKPCQCAILVPNAFSPNENGRNDDFKVFSNCDLPNLQMEIYNSWGQKLYESNTGKAWNGSFQGSTVQEGNYLYIIRFIDPISNGNRVLQGRFLLLR